ncbi:hypothetical protein ACFL17_06565 [Pseudomonadota bacterium]
MSLTSDDFKMIEDVSIPLDQAIKEIVQPHMGPFKIDIAKISRQDGSETEDTHLLVHSSENENVVPIDSVALVIDCHEKMTGEVLESAYRRIQEVKSIEKSVLENPRGGDVFMTVSMILSRDSVLPIEEISAKMGSLNNTIPSLKWPDAVAILSKGIINYSAHIPNQEGTGDFFLPADDSNTNSSSPPMFIRKVIRAGGDKTLDKVVSLIIARLKIFEPSAILPNYLTFLEDFPSHGLTTQTYQFNLSLVLVPMTPEQVFTAHLPGNIFNIKSGKKTLGSVQFLEWQDGGVFVIRGGFPLDIFMVFLRVVVPNIKHSDLSYFRGAGMQVSYVLPIGPREFLRTLDIFERRSSNIRVEKDTSKFLVQKTEDEGTSSPFFARLMMGIMNTRDVVFEDKQGRDRFDNLYEPVISNIKNARQTAKEISDMWEDHREKVASGTIVNTQGITVQISESIDRKIKRDVDNFIHISARTIKQSMQDLVNHLDVDIGFLFKKKPAFNSGLSQLRAQAPALADYLANVRLWSESLILMRNEGIEHGVYAFQNVKYDLYSDPITALEPEIDGKPVTELTSEILDRICCFVEEVTIHCLQKKFPRGLNITEVPPADRDPDNAERYLLTLEPGGKTPWQLLVHNSKFEEV